MSAMFRLMGPRWWGALAMACVFVLVYRTSVVGAPAQAGDRFRAIGAEPGIVNHSIRMPAGATSPLLADQIVSLEEQLRAERHRAQELAAESAVLQRQFDTLTALTLDLLDEADAPSPSTVGTDVPIPAEAIYVMPSLNDR